MEEYVIVKAGGGAEQGAGAQAGAAQVFEGISGFDIAVHGCEFPGGGIPHDDLTVAVGGAVVAVEVRRKVAAGTDGSILAFTNSSDFTHYGGGGIAVKIVDFQIVRGGDARTAGDFGGEEAAVHGLGEGDFSGSRHNTAPEDAGCGPRGLGRAGGCSRRRGVWALHISVLWIGGV